MKPTEGDFIDGPRDTGLNEAKPPEALLSHIQNNSNRHKNPHDHNYNSQNQIQVIFNFYTKNNLLRMKLTREKYSINFWRKI